MKTDKKNLLIKGIGCSHLKCGSGFFSNCILIKNNWWHAALIESSPLDFMVLLS